jgi:hypothetical protein
MSSVSLYSKSTIFTFQVLLLSFIPYILISSLPIFYKPFVEILYLIIVIITLFDFIDSCKSIIRSSITFFGVIILTISVKSILYLELHVSAFIFPLVTFVLLNKMNGLSLSRGIFEKFMIITYFYYYFVYYSLLPNFWLRPGFNEDLFDNSSSNSIPIVLNSMFFFYLVILSHDKVNFNVRLFLFSFLNLFFCTVQQGRGGMIVSLFAFLYTVYSWNRKTFFLVTIALIISSIVFFDQLSDFYMLIQSDDISNIHNDNRFLAQSSFFTELNMLSFLVGFNNLTLLEGTFTSTFNSWLDVALNYGFVTLVLLIFFVLRRVFVDGKLYFRYLFFLSPMIIYSLMEGFVFTGYLELGIYSFIFLRSSKLEASAS